MLWRMLFLARTLSCLHALICMFWVWMRYKNCTQVIHTLVQFLPSAQLREGLMISTCTRAFFSNKTNFAFRIRPFASCFWRNHIVEDLWDTLAATRPMPCCPLTTFGQGCFATSHASSQNVRPAYKLSPLPILMAFTPLCQYVRFLGLT